MTLCPRIKTCEEYRSKRRYRFIEKKRCGWKEFWSKCPLRQEKA